MIADEPQGETKTYLMETKNGTLRKITVPADWKVTFGPTVPFSRKDGEVGGGKSCALRFYEGAEKQRAVFTDVVAFRDLSLKVEEQITKTRQETFYKDTPAGRKQSVVEARVTEWHDPLEPHEPVASSEDTGRIEFSQAAERE